MEIILILLQMHASVLGIMAILIICSPKINIKAWNARELAVSFIATLYSMGKDPVKIFTIMVVISSIS